MSSMAARIALVTGAGSGIGRAAALGLHAAGFQLVLAGRREAALRETAALAKAGPEMVVVPTDVAHAPSVDALFAAVRERFQRVDVLFNNAGINLPNGAIDEVGLDAWHRVMNVNVTGAFLCAQAAFRLMKEQAPRGGRIINNGSVARHAPRPENVPYTVSKHAITGLTKALALDGRRYDIACSQIDIGNARTAMARRIGEGIKQANGSIMAEPTMDVAHVANAIVHIADLPLDVNVQFMTVMATKMPFVGRG